MTCSVPGIRLVVAAMLAACVVGQLGAQQPSEGPPRSARASARTLRGRQPVLLSPELSQAAVQSGRLRVIIGLAVPYAPESILDALERAQQQIDIAAAQTLLEGTLALFGASDMKRFQVLPAMAAELDAAALSLLAADPRVQYLEIDRLERPSLAQSTAIVGAPTVWSRGYTGASQTVAVLDTGVDRNHPFLAGRVVAEACFSSSGATFTSLCTAASGPGSTAPCPLEDCAHGTHVAGIAAGQGNSFSGVAPAAAVMAVQVFTRFDDPGVCGGPEPCVAAFVSDQIRGLEHVYNQRQSFNVAAANMSLGGGSYSSQAQCDAQNGSRKTIIDTLRAAGIATVVASGNDAQVNGISSPGCISGAISVGSTNDGSSGAVPVDAVSSFSNAAPYLSLFAPGWAITSSVPGGGFATYAGTSMAAPHVAGAFALYRSRFPSASVSAMLQAFRSTGSPIQDQRAGATTTAPRINIAAAMGLLNETPACTYTVTPLATTVAAGESVVSIEVATQAGCPWQAGSNAPFITVSAPAARTGSGTATLSIARNPSAATRSGTVTVAGQTVTITQRAALPLNFNGDNAIDLLWHHRGDGRVAAWLMNGLTLRDGVLVDQVADTGWNLVGAGDLDGDGGTELIWHHLVDGRIAAWFMSGLVRQSGVQIGQVADTQWRIRAVADMDLDGRGDLIWQHQGNGSLAIWRMNGAAVLEGTSLSPAQVADTNWVIVGAADFDGNNTRDLVWRHRGDGRNAVWFMNGTSLTSGVALPGLPDANWEIRAVGDMNGDQRPDLIWQHTGDGRIAAWLLNGVSMLSGELLSPSAVPDTNWHIVGPR